MKTKFEKDYIEEKRNTENTNMSEMTKRAKTYRLPNPATAEDLETRWRKVLNFGESVIMAGYYYNGQNKPCYFGAVYEHLDDDMSCEGILGLKDVSGIEFEDDGHAIFWTMNI